MKPLSLKTCYALAWKSFRKWWIPLCLISGFIFIFELIPRLVLYPEMVELKQTLFENAPQMVSAANSGELEEFNALILEINEQVLSYWIKLVKWVAILFPFGAILTIVLLMRANMAVKDQRERNSIGRTLYIVMVHVLLAVIKISAFVFCILPGFYIYVRLFFVPLILLEEKETGLVEALTKSWVMTRGNFWTLSGVVSINIACQVAAAPTIIGMIPVTGFVNTARAAAYQMLKIPIAY
jgi:hypothetical protein